MKINILDNTFELLPQKAILWKEQKTLLISDLHLGKVMHFRKAGIAVPSIASENNFIRLHEMLSQHDVGRIIILGDLFHNQLNEEWNQLAEWRNKYPSIEIITVLGNHDILPKELFDSLNIRLESHLEEGNFLFTHHPFDEPDKNRITFCGHIHPVYCLRSMTKQSLKFPCFVVDEYQVVLPSFGIFTGGYEMKSEANRKIFIIAEKKIIAI